MEVEAVLLASMTAFFENINATPRIGGPPTKTALANARESCGEHPFRYLWPLRSPYAALIQGSTFSFDALYKQVRQ